MRAIAIILALAPLAAGAAHPLYTDDTATQGAGGWQLEANVDRVHARDGSPAADMSNATLTWGAGDTVDVFVNALWLRQFDGEVMQVGAGDVSLGLKWRLFDAGALALSVKPAVTLPTASRESGLGNGQALCSLGLAASWSGERWMLMANATGAYLAADNGNQKGLWSLAAGGTLRITDSLRLAGEWVAYTGEDPGNRKKPAFAGVGLIYGATDSVDVDLGFRLGLNDAQYRRSFGAGLAVHW